MARESLKACQAGINKAKIALTDKGWTQQKLADEVETTRQPIANFFRGKGVDRKNFVKICGLLELDWQEIAGFDILPKLPSLSEEGDLHLDIEVLIKEMREKVKPYIQERCGTMRVLDMTQPLELNDIYTNVNILENPTAKKRIQINQLQSILLKDFDRFGLGRIIEERVPGIEAVEKHSKIIILGKPGAGKTTFLKYLAIQCIEDKFLSNQVPIFITLKDFAETWYRPNLFKYIFSQFSTYKVAETKGKTEELLTQGRAFILLDGLDEVREEDSDRILKEIKKFTEQFHKNHFVITCRIAAKEYTFENFTEVEVADFAPEQIFKFANNWFRYENSYKASRFLLRLEENPPIRELATNPLLLTLLCLVFQESSDFPSNRSELYQEGLNILLKKWDAKRNIEREQFYKKLSIKRKEDLLSHIGLITFEKKDYLFKQDVLEQYIADYIRNLPETQNDIELLQMDAEAVLKSIEAQHGLLVERARGIYSFSHITFQEYFAARKSIASRELLKNLANFITDKRWREVLLLAVGMMQNAEELIYLMKEQIDNILISDPKYNQLLNSIYQKSLKVQVPYKSVLVRAFYFDLELFKLNNCNFYLSQALDTNFSKNLKFGCNHEQDFILDYNLKFIMSATSGRDLDISIARIIAIAPYLKQPLQQINKQYKIQQNINEWQRELRALIIEKRNILYEWNFSKQQYELLQKYYNATAFLLDCINSDCYISRELRQEIEDSLLLPVQE